MIFTPLLCLPGTSSGWSEKHSTSIYIKGRWKKPMQNTQRKVLQLYPCIIIRLWLPSVSTMGATGDTEKRPLSTFLSSPKSKVVGFRKPFPTAEPPLDWTVFWASSMVTFFAVFDKPSIMLICIRCDGCEGDTQ